MKKALYRIYKRRVYFRYLQLQLKQQQRRYRIIQARNFIHNNEDMHIDYIVIMCCDILRCDNKNAVEDFVFDYIGRSLGIDLPYEINFEKSFQL